MKEALERLAAVLTMEEVQGLLEGTHQVTKVPPKRAKTAKEIGEFLRFNKPSLIVHRGWAKALDECTFGVLSNVGDLIQPIAVNYTLFDAKNAPHLFLDRTGVPTRGATDVARVGRYPGGLWGGR